jgi:hypothetical protein
MVCFDLDAASRAVTDAPDRTRYPAPRVIRHRGSSTGSRDLDARGLWITATPPRHPLSRLRTSATVQ